MKGEERWFRRTLPNKAQHPIPLFVLLISHFHLGHLKFLAAAVGLWGGGGHWSWADRSGNGGHLILECWESEGFLGDPVQSLQIWWKKGGQPPGEPVIPAVVLKVLVGQNFQNDPSLYFSWSIKSLPGGMCWLA